MSGVVIQQRERVRYAVNVTTLKMAAGTVHQGRLAAMTERREDIALELARKICGALPLLREVVSSDLDSVAALLRPHVCHEGQIDDSFVEAVEDQIGMGHGAWDMVDPKTICRAVLKVAERDAALLLPHVWEWIPPSELPPVEHQREGFTRWLLVAHRRYDEPVRGRYIHKLKEWRIDGSNSNMNDYIYGWMMLPALPSAPLSLESKGETNDRL